MKLVQVKLVQVKLVQVKLVQVKLVQGLESGVLQNDAKKADEGVGCGKKDPT